MSNYNIFDLTAKLQNSLRIVGKNRNKIKIVINNMLISNKPQKANKKLPKTNSTSNLSIPDLSISASKESKVAKKLRNQSERVERKFFITDNDQNKHEKQYLIENKYKTLKNEGSRNHKMFKTSSLPSI